MRRQSILIMLAAFVGAGAGALGVAAWMRDTPAPAVIPRDGMPAKNLEQLSDIVDALARTLNDEIIERRILAEQFEQLRSDLRGLEQLRRPAETAGNPFVDETAADVVDETAEMSFEDRLAAAGISPAQLDTIRRLEAQARMRSIELDDQARREGWVNTPRYFEEMQEGTTAASSIRATLGDEAYEQYLFASDRPNRVAVQSILDLSPAAAAGFRPGDVVVRYGGEEVYSTQQLTRLRSTGIAGQRVTVDVLRDGRLVQLTMPRGPMGIATGPRVVDPASLRE